VNWTELCEHRVGWRKETYTQPAEHESVLFLGVFNDALWTTRVI